MAELKEAIVFDTSRVSIISANALVGFTQKPD